MIMEFDRLKALLTVALLVWAVTDRSMASPVDGIEPAHLSMTDCPTEPGCPALILLDEWELNNESNRTRYSTRRLTKVFTSEGIDEHAQVEVSAAVGGIEVRNLSGRTILPDGTTVKLDQDNVHVKVLRKGKRHVKVKSATFPAVVPGAIIEYSYDVVTSPHSFITDVTWEIQQEIPILKSLFTLKQGEFELAATPAGSPIEVKHTHPFKNVDYYTAENVPSLPEEPLAPPPESLRARFYFGLPGLKERWLGVAAARYAGMTGKYLEPDQALRDKVAEITGSESSQSGKIRAIYRFVQEEIGSEELRAQDTAERDDSGGAGGILARGYGSEFERTMLFMSMAKAAGLEVGFLLIVSRYSGVFEQEAPDESQFDSYAAAVKTGAGWTFYDPAVRHCDLGAVSAEKESHVENALLITPHKGYGKEVEAIFQNLRVMTLEGAPYAVATIPFSRAAKNLVKVTASLTVSPDGAATLRATRTGKGHADLDVRSSYERLDAGERTEKLQAAVRQRFHRADLVSAAFQDIDSFEKDATIEYEASIPEFARVVGDSILIPSSVFPHTSLPNPFTSEARRSDIHFPYPKTVRETVSIEIPEGYAVDSLPGTVSVNETPLAMRTTYSEGVGTITLTRTLNIDTGSWPAADYARLRAFYQKLQEADQQVIVLKKIPSGDTGS